MFNFKYRCAICGKWGRNIDHAMVILIELSYDGFYMPIWIENMYDIYRHNECLSAALSSPQKYDKKIVERAIEIKEGEKRFSLRVQQKQKDRQELNLKAGSLS